MKLLYRLSFALHAPFWFAAVVFGAVAALFQWLAEMIHDATTYRAWHVLHMRANCAWQFRQAAPTQPRNPDSTNPTTK